ncbi:MAG: hypothetical protein LAT83_11790 [Kiritimatiellae bacterium]|nr:hypothetical protein [Kiritimatiellia bacterium]
MKKTGILIAAIAAFVIFVAVLVFVRHREHARNAVLVARVQATVAEDLSSIVIRPHQLSRESWEIVISERKELASFREAATHADEQLISGHSGPIGEWTLTLHLVSGTEHHYLASVHRYESADLFITDEFYIETKSGVYSRGNPRTARLPGLGPWIMKRAPQGRLGD